MQWSSPWDRTWSGSGKAGKKSNWGWGNELCWRLLLGAWHDCKVSKDLLSRNFYGCLRDFQDEAKKKGHPWTLAKVGFTDSSIEKNTCFEIDWYVIRCLTPVCQSAHSSPWMPYQTHTMFHCGARWHNGIESLGGQAAHCRWMVSSDKRATPKIWFSHCPDLSPTFPHTLPWVSVISIQPHASRSMLFRWGRFDPYGHTVWGWPSLEGRCDNRRNPRSHGDRIPCSQRVLDSFLLNSELYRRGCHQRYYYRVTLLLRLEINPTCPWSAEGCWTRGSSEVSRAICLPEHQELEQIHAIVHCTRNQGQSISPGASGYSKASALWSSLSLSVWGFSTYNGRWWTGTLITG